jgi:K+-sensing histidine kinase KdpD
VRSEKEVESGHMNILEWLSRLPKKYQIIIGFLLTMVIGHIDYVTGYEFRMELFYLIPISYVAWFVGRRIGVLFSVLSIATIVFSDIMAGKKYTSFAIEFWNGAIYFVFYVIVALLLKLRISLQQRQDLIEELDSALKQNEELSGMLPVCPSCKKIRDDQEYRQKVESYISKHTNEEFSRSLCKECAAKL